MRPNDFCQVEKSKCLPADTRKFSDVLCSVLSLEFYDDAGGGERRHKNICKTGSVEKPYKRFLKLFRTYVCFSRVCNAAVQ